MRNVLGPIKSCVESGYGPMWRHFVPLVRHLLCITGLSAIVIAWPPELVGKQGWGVANDANATRKNALGEHRYRDSGFYVHSVMHFTVISQASLPKQAFPS